VLARYLKTQLLVLLCGGLVGPIFLVVYFTLGLGSLLQWMLYVGLLITVADVLIALALTNYGAKSAAKTAELEQHGVGWATSPRASLLSWLIPPPRSTKSTGSEALWSTDWCPHNSPWPKTTGPTTSAGKPAR
jgi:hypothetical protein